jgi:hypothetical protein
MGGNDSSDMMLYTYLDERQTVCYWKKVAFNILARKLPEKKESQCSTKRGDGEPPDATRG